VFDHVHLRVSDLEASKAFYETVLAPLGIEKTWDDGKLVEFGDLALSADGPVSENIHLAFVAGSREVVEAFHRAGVEAGFRSNGAPGLREYGHGYFAAYLLDPDTNNVEAVLHEQE
jgi:catechol 2,3-dioxygenase-like lactoylglutathione lyase family enzyme